MEDLRLINRGNSILRDIFSKSVHSIRQLTIDEASAKGFYRFLQNDRVSEEDIISNMVHNCQSACKGQYLVCIQDTTEINLSSHRNRIRKDDFIGTTNANSDRGLGFFIHPTFVLDASNGTPLGYADVKLWNRPLDFSSKFERNYSSLPIEDKESYKWIESSQKAIAALHPHTPGMLIVQDREGDLYEQFATIPDHKTDLLIRSRANRTLADKTKLFDCLKPQPAQGSYTLVVNGKGNRKKRTANIEVRFKQVTLPKTNSTSRGVAPSVKLHYIEAKEVGYKGTDNIHWRLLTTLDVENYEVAKMCIEWYSWRWTIEEVFKILKKEGYNIEATELEYASSVRKLSLMIMEVIIKLFLMRIAYSEPEINLEAATCFSPEEQVFLEHQIKHLEGKTAKQKNPFPANDLKRYVWVIARLGGWKGYESKRHPGITTLWNGLKYFDAAMQGWIISRNVSTR